MGPEHNCHYKAQIDKLANFLMKEFPDEFGRAGPEGESAVEMTIRLLEDYKQYVGD